MNTFRRNVPLLATSQALMMSNMSLLLTTAALVGLDLAPDKAYATLPLAVIFIAVMLTSIPAAILMEKIGRKPAFMLATLFGMTGGVMATIAIFNRDFWLFVASGMLVGMFNAFGNYFRFAAADIVAPDLKSKAISAVLLGGVVAAVVGPNLANLTRESVTGVLFAGSYMAMIVLYFLALLTLSFLKLPNHANLTKQSNIDKGRPLLEIASQPKFIVAMLCATLGYAVMSFIMTATPLAMHDHMHNFSDTSFVISWHVLAMFVPSFITGTLIQRFGVLQIMFIGALLGIGCVVANLLGNSVSHYWFGLVLLGISWNFLFIGGTTLLTETYLQQERAKAQAMNDFTIFTTVAIASLSAGSLQFHFGWQLINLAVLPLLGIILISIVILALSTTRQKTAS